jgi:endonuclease YncB( thermonuclease family)
LLFNLQTKVIKSFLLLAFTPTAFTGFCQQTCIVTRVIDGDIYNILHNGKAETLRLMDVDAQICQYFGINAWQAPGFYQSERCKAGQSFNCPRMGLLLYKYSHNKRLAIYEADAKRHSYGVWKNPIQWQNKKESSN